MSSAKTASLMPKEWQNRMVDGPAETAGGSAGTGSAVPREVRSAKPSRLVSLDAYRGFIMTMLAANGFGILAFSKIAADAPVWGVHDYAWWQNLAQQFEHPRWVSLLGTAGVSFWDLIQPAFMFMVGVSMPFSYGRRSLMGQSDTARMFHALIRSVVLVLLGVFLNSMRHSHTDWAFPNVLAQIGLGYFFVWLLLHRSFGVQVISLVLLLGANWLMFFVNPPPGDYDYEAVHASREHGEVFEGRFAPWSKNANTAFQFDQWLLPRLRTPPRPPEAAAGDRPADDSPAAADSDAAPASGTEPNEPLVGANEPASPHPERSSFLWRWFFSNPEPYAPNRGGYTTLNFIPSMGTMLIGVMCGQLLLLSRLTQWKKLGILLVVSAGCLALGIGLHHVACPIVKRIWTPSWVLFSAGYVIAMLAVFYLLFDLLPLRRLAFPLVVVGMNSILIYMMGQLIRGWTAENVLKTHFGGAIESLWGPRALDPNWYGPLTEATGVFVLFWLFLYWLYRQRIFLRI